MNLILPETIGESVFRPRVSGLLLDPHTQQLGRIFSQAHRPRDVTNEIGSHLNIDEADMQEPNIWAFSNALEEFDHLGIPVDKQQLLSDCVTDLSLAAVRFRRIAIPNEQEEGFDYQGDFDMPLGVKISIGSKINYRPVPAYLVPLIKREFLSVLNKDYRFRWLSSGSTPGFVM